MAHQPYIIAVDLESASREARIYAAEAFSLELLSQLYADRLEWQTRVSWSEQQGKLVGESVKTYEALTLLARPLATLPPDRVLEAMLAAVRQHPGLLATSPLQQLQGRMTLLRETLGEQWPDWSTKGLLDSLGQWLAPYLTDITRLTQLERMPLHTVQPIKLGAAENIQSTCS